MLLTIFFVVATVLVVYKLFAIHTVLENITTAMASVSDELLSMSLELTDIKINTDHEG